MRNFSKYFLLSFFAIGSLFTFSSYGRTNQSGTIQFYQHNIQLQLSDSYGFPVPGTEFWITLDIVKNGPVVTLHVPLINFTTGQTANFPGEPAPLIPGGYLYTANGFLPPELSPSDLVPHSVIAASNNGLSPVFSFTEPVDDFPVPPYGYILQVTNAGALQVQCAGTFGNIIPPGPQILMPTSITYIVKPSSTLFRNIPLSTGATSTTQFVGGFGPNFGLRDLHINDAYNGIAAWAWLDNSMVADKTNNVLNVMVATGQTDSQGRLKVNAPIQLTNLQPPLSASFDTAVAINRTNSNNIVVSYTLDNYDATSSPFDVTFTPCRAVSFDGGKTWPAEYNGPTNIQPTGPVGLGDNPGVASDKYGNIWYCATNFFTNAVAEVNSPFFMVSTDGGITFQLVYTVPLPDPIEFPLGTFVFDYPQYCFGGDGLGNYGLWFNAAFHPSSGDGWPTVGFIPIFGPGSWATPTSNPTFTYTQLAGLDNSIGESVMAASSDGRVFFQGVLATSIENSYNGTECPFTYIQPLCTLFKSPGSIAENYAGSWNYGMLNTIQFNTFPPISSLEVISQPWYGYFPGPRGIIYDESRQAIYAILAIRSPDYSQNMRICFIISRDNMQTWSDPIDIATTDFANRGFPSMALDTVTGNLVFGWYDGRNDPTYESVEYYAAIITAQQLDQLVAGIPLSDPIYVVPAATGIIG